MKKIFLVLLLGYGFIWEGFSQINFFRTYGEGVYNSGQAVMQHLADSGYIVCGAINEGNGNGHGVDMMLLKTDSMGVQQWRKSIGGVGIDFAKHFTYALGENGFVLAGYTNRNGSYDGLIVATDLNGDTVWTKVIGGADWDMLYSIDTTYDGCYIVAGETFSYGAGNSDAWVMKLDSVGNTLWTKYIGGPADDNARWIFEMPDSSIVVVGSTKSYGAGASDVYVVLMNNAGDTTWTRTVGSVRDDFGYSGDFYRDNGGNYSIMIGGNTHHDSPDFYTFYCPRFTLTGNLLYVQEGDGTDGHDRNYSRVRNEGNGGTFYLGLQYKQPWNSTWQLELSRTYYGFSYGYVVREFGSVFSDYLWDVWKTHDKGYVLVGETDGIGPNTKACILVRVDSVASVVPQPLLDVEDENSIQFSVYPNPVSEQFFVTGLSLNQDVKIEILSITGNVILSRSGSVSSTESFNLSGLPSGMYIVRITSGSNSLVRKLMKN